MIPTAEDVLGEKGSEMISVTPESTIYDALSRMAERNIGAILVKENQEFLGIWTERDLVRNSLSEGFDVKTARIRDYMTKELLSVPHDCPIFRIADLFLGKRVRRMLVEREGQYIGLLTVGDVMRAALVAREDELRKLEAFAHLEYYDDWRWKRKKR